MFKIYPLSILGSYTENGNLIRFNSNTILKKGLNLKFELSVPNSIQIKTIGLIVSNAGYEASKANCLRGKVEKVTKDNKYDDRKIFYREEETSYKGNHFVQGVIESTNGKKYYSQILIIRIV